MSQEELNKILELHKLWLDSDRAEGGERANLRDADLRDADLRDADLRDADLRCANLRDADLRDADLRDADLRDADLRDADLRDANLRCADLRDANLRCANLRCADLPNKTFLIYGEYYFIQIHNDNVRAGCECHSADNWRNFNTEIIKEMDGDEAVKFYPRLLEIIDFYCGNGDK